MALQNEAMQCYSFTHSKQSGRSGLSVVTFLQPKHVHLHVNLDLKEGGHVKFLFYWLFLNLGLSTVHIIFC